MTGPALMELHAKLHNAGDVDGRAREAVRSRLRALAKARGWPYLYVRPGFVIGVPVVGVPGQESNDLEWGWFCDCNQQLADLALAYSRLEALAS